MKVLSTHISDERHTRALRAALVEVVAPSWVVAFGDRRDMLEAVLAEHYAGKSIVHVGGGDTPHGTDSHPDHRTRDAISMLARVHCVANYYAAENLVFIGLDADDIHITGSPGLDEVVAYTKTLDPERKRTVGTFEWHPESEQEGVYIPTSSKRLPPDKFLWMIAHCKLFRTSSSAALYEAPILGTPVELVGDRQAGRRGPYHHPEGRACEAIRKVVLEVCCG